LFNNYIIFLVLQTEFIKSQIAISELILSKFYSLKPSKNTFFRTRTRNEKGLQLRHRRLAAKSRRVNFQKIFKFNFRKNSSSLKKKTHRRLSAVSKTSPPRCCSTSTKSRPTKSRATTTTTLQTSTSKVAVITQCRENRLGRRRRFSIFSEKNSGRNVAELGLAENEADPEELSSLVSIVKIHLRVKRARV
jgi:hypothetical protein